MKKPTTRHKGSPAFAGSARLLKTAEKVMTKTLKSEIKSMFAELPSAIAEACMEDADAALAELYINQFGDGACMMIWGDEHRELSDLVDDWIKSHITGAILPMNEDDWDYVDSVVSDFERQAKRLREARDRLNDQHQATASTKL
jgi:hypothetical protein